jgi:hypothetical protein
MIESLPCSGRRLCAAPRFAVEAGEVAGERIVELRKVAPNDVHVERAQDRFFRLAIEEKPHHGFDAAPSSIQRSVSSACIVTRCRLWPRPSRTMTSKIRPPPGSGVTETEGSLISDTHRRRAIGCVQTGSGTLKTEPC